MPYDVQIVSASWCGACKKIKPDVAATCRLAGLTLVEVDYEAMEEPEKSSIVALPTIRMRLTPSEKWTHYTKQTVDTWKEIVTAAAVAYADF
jgi:thiol-disulfide isomerase/thioredoxin